MRPFIAIFSMLLGAGFSEPESRLVRLPATGEIERADLNFWKPEGKLQAVLIFCPGHNGSGESFSNRKEWRAFAEQNRVGLCGLSFASPMKLTKQGKGYSHAGRESGDILLAALKREFNRNDLPLLLYGYSAGARFSTSFLAWKPDRVMSWCASGVGTWPDLPSAKNVAPGIVACGEFDAACYWSSLNYFQSGRKRGYPWVWISLEKTQHEQSHELDGFARDYFHLVLSGRQHSFAEKKFDIATHRPVAGKGTFQWEIFSSCLPSNRKLIEKWVKIHHP